MANQDMGKMKSRFVYSSCLLCEYEGTNSPKELYGILLTSNRPTWKRKSSSHHKEIQ